MKDLPIGTVTGVQPQSPTLIPLPPRTPSRPPEEPPVEGSAEVSALAEDAFNLNPMAERLLAEVRRSLEFYATQGGGGSVSRVIVSGGSSQLNGLTELLSMRLGLSVGRVNPFEDIQGADELGPEHHAAFGLALSALGAAPIDANLVPPDIALRRHARRRAQYVVVAAVLGVALAAELGWMGWSLYSGQRKFNDNLAAKMEAPAEVGGQPLLNAEGNPIKYSEALAEVQKFEVEQQKLTERLEAIQELATGRARWLDVFDELLRLLPEKTWLVGGFAFSKSGFTLNLSTNQDGRWRDWDVNLSRSSLFKNQSITYGVTNQGNYWTWTNTIGIQWEVAPADAAAPAEGAAPTEAVAPTEGAAPAEGAVAEETAGEASDGH